MVAFTFILREKKGNWSAIRCSEEEGELQADADSTYDLQQKLYQLALQNSSGGGVKTSFSTISPKSAIYQVRALTYWEGEDQICSTAPLEKLNPACRGFFSRWWLCRLGQPSRG